MNKQEVAQILKTGGVGVVPTDTIYGLSASAFRPEAIDRIYRLKKKDQSQPLIVLIANIETLEKFDILVTHHQNTVLEKLWPGPVSVILPGGRAFRLPDKPDLIELIKQAGPLVSTSANLSGAPPATTIEEAREYFGDAVDFYLDGGQLSGAPSTLISLARGKLEILRQGSVIIPQDLLEKIIEGNVHV